MIAAKHVSDIVVHKQRASLVVRRVHRSPESAQLDNSFTTLFVISKSAAAVALADILQAQMCNATDLRNPLQLAGILKHVLDYVGPGHWCFVAETSSLWRDTYKRVACRELYSFTMPWRNISCVPQMTLYSAVYASPSRLRHAHKLKCTATKFEIAAGMFADVATLKTAYELGMCHGSAAAMEGAVQCNTLVVVQFLHAGLESFWYRWPDRAFSTAARRGNMELCQYLYDNDCGWGSETCEAAASGGHTDILRWLREHECLWDEINTAHAAAEGGCVDVLDYLQQEGIMLDADLLRETLCTAAVHNKLAAAQ
jgi:hypothetical protein